MIITVNRQTKIDNRYKNKNWNKSKKEKEKNRRNQNYKDKNNYSNNKSSIQRMMMEWTRR